MVAQSHHAKCHHGLGAWLQRIEGKLRTGQWSLGRGAYRRVTLFPSPGWLQAQSDGQEVEKAFYFLEPEPLETEGWDHSLDNPHSPHLPTCLLQASLACDPVQDRALCDC